MTPTTDLQKLLAEATSGPWRVEETTWDVWDVIEVHAVNADPDDDPIAHFYKVNCWPEGAGADTFRNDQANACLIAMAPDLAARVIELEAENKRLRDLLAKAEAEQCASCRHCDSFGFRAALKGGEI